LFVWIELALCVNQVLSGPVIGVNCLSLERQLGLHCLIVPV